MGKSQADLLPVKSKREKTIHLHRDVAVIYSGKDLLLQRGKKGRVMADLWEFPYFDRGVNIQEALDIPLLLKGNLDKVSHGFTKYKAFLYPHLYEGKKVPLRNYEWVAFERVKHIPFSSGHRQIVDHLRNHSILGI